MQNVWATWLSAIGAIGIYIYYLPEASFVTLTSGEPVFGGFRFIQKTWWRHLHGLQTTSIFRSVVKGLADPDFCRPQHLRS